jgi:hypothetical protein
MRAGQRRSLPGASHRLTCFACRARNDVADESVDFACAACGRRNLILGCGRCGGAQVAADNRSKARTGWTCYWCLQPLTRPGRPGRDQPTAADAWKSLERHGLTNGDTQVRVLGGFELIAGSDDWPPPGTLCSIATLADGVLVVAESGATGHTLLPYPDLLELEVGGRGLLTYGGRYIGGGRGLTGALTGMAVASMLNNATRNTAIDSFLRLTSKNTEMLLRHWQYDPETVRGSLSRMFTAHLAATRVATAPAPVVIQQPRTEPIAAGPIDELERLTKLHAAGTLTDTEFEMARAKQIKQLHAGKKD